MSTTAAPEHRPARRRPPAFVRDFTRHATRLLNPRRALALTARVGAVGFVFTPLTRAGVLPRGGWPEFLAALAVVFPAMYGPGVWHALTRLRARRRAGEIERRGAEFYAAAPATERARDAYVALGAGLEAIGATFDFLDLARRLDELGGRRTRTEYAAAERCHALALAARAMLAPARAATDNRAAPELAAVIDYADEALAILARLLDLYPVDTPRARAAFARSARRMLDTRDMLDMATQWLAAERALGCDRMAPALRRSFLAARVTVALTHHELVALGPADAATPRTPRRTDTPRPRRVLVAPLGAHAPPALTA